jgi:transposase
LSRLIRTGQSSA